MDIWQWIHDLEDDLLDAGEHRLRNLIYSIPRATVDNDQTTLEAQLPEAIAGAQRLNSPWLELYFRHWQLQGRVLVQGDVKGNLDEAVALLDFAHTDDTESCPQGICAVQDLAHCYSLIDGPGFAEQRIAVAEEALGKIDARWDCHSCITSELVTALIDKGEIEQAWENFQTRRRAAEQAGELDNEFLLNECNLLVITGRADEALQRFETAPVYSNAGSNGARQRAVGKAAALFALNRYPEAVESLPTYSEVSLQHRAEIAWIRVAADLHANGHSPASAAFGELVAESASRASHYGRLRQTIELSSLQAKLAAAEVDWLTVNLALDRMKATATQLPLPLDAPEQIKQVRTLLAGIDQTKTSPRTNQQETLDWIDGLAQSSEAPPAILTGLWQAHERWPDNTQILNALCQRLESQHWQPVAQRLLESQLVAHPENAEVIELWGFSKLTGGADGVRQLLEKSRTEINLKPDATQSSAWRWLRAQALDQVGEPEDALQILVELTERGTDGAGLRRFKADLCCRLDKLNDAAMDLEWLVENERASANDLWDRMTINTRLRRWDHVRESAVELGLPISTSERADQPIEENWEYCRIEFQTTEGETNGVTAQRTGPVTARLADIPAPDLGYDYRDEVVFDPSPVNQRPEDDQESDTDFRYEYRFIERLKASGDTTYELDGLDPGKEKLDAFETDLEDLQIPTSRRDGGDYRIQIEGPQDNNEVERAAVYYRFAIHDSKVKKAAAVFATHFESAELMVWTRLARAAGDLKRADAHAELASRYNLDA